MESKELQSVNIEELLKGKKIQFCSSEEALKDITPIAWSQDVIEGNTKVVVEKSTN